MDADSIYLPGFDPDRTFDEEVARVTDQWPCDWDIYWALDNEHAPSYLIPDQWEDAVRLNQYAERLVAAAGRLSRRKLPEERRTLPAWLAAESESERAMYDEIARDLREKLSPDQLNERRWQFILGAIEGETPAERRERIFRTAVEIRAHEAFGYSPRFLAERVLALLAYLVSTRSERVQAYLHRVARCFILDLRPELAIMSRAVMEAALQDVSLEPLVEGIRSIRGRRFATLVDWIEAASAAGLLDEAGRIAAERVRSAGDDAVHQSPGLTPDPASILADLLAVLDQIVRGSNG